MSHVPPIVPSQAPADAPVDVARWLDPALPGMLVARRFAVTRPGFDRDEVLDLLAELATGLATLQQAVRSYERALVARPTPAPVDAHGD